MFIIIHYYNLLSVFLKKSPIIRMHIHPKSARIDKGGVQNDKKMSVQF